MRALRLFAFAVALGRIASPLASQNDGQLVAAGYAAPGPVEAAPGQVMTLFFRGVGPALDGFPRAGEAASTPLPYALGGLSVWLEQLPRPTLIAVPLLSVRQHNECEEASGRPACLLTAVRVQIPTEMTAVFAKITLEADGEPSRTFLLRPFRDNAHLLTTCDLDGDTNPASACGRVAFHNDGELVSPDNPARRGETLVLYAYGMGPTNPAPASGTPSPTGAEVIESVRRQVAVRFAPFRNADPSTPRYPDDEPEGIEGAIAFVGLTPGYVGLYQINVPVPPSLEIPIACGGDTISNVLAKVSTSRGVESLPLCVEP